MSQPRDALVTSMWYSKRTSHNSYYTYPCRSLWWGTTIRRNSYAILLLITTLHPILIAAAGEQKFIFPPMIVFKFLFTFIALMHKKGPPHANQRLRTIDPNNCWLQLITVAYKLLCQEGLYNNPDGQDNLLTIPV
jgi:hypothetical protein